MPTYSKIVSTVKKIDSAHVFIGGTRKDIQSGWVFINGQRKQIFPSSEVYTQVYSKTTAGSYSTSLSWGKYKIVISGGGGSGGAASATHSDYQNYVNSGSAGQQIEVIVNIGTGETKTISGIVGQGGMASYAYARKGNGSGWDPSVYATATAGNAGTGYASGSKGNTKIGWGDQYQYDTSAVAGGSGGGSSSLVINGVLNAITKGGNGGSASADKIGEVAGGNGGSGGVSSGSGSAGGTGVFGYKSAATSGNGTDGFIRVYKSNLYPN